MKPRILTPALIGWLMLWSGLQRTEGAGFADVVCGLILLTACLMVYVIHIERKERKEKRKYLPYDSKNPGIEVDE